MQLEILFWEVILVFLTEQSFPGAYGSKSYRFVTTVKL